MDLGPFTSGTSIRLSWTLFERLTGTQGVVALQNSANLDRLPSEAAVHEWIWHCGLRLLIIPAYIGESLHVGHGISPAAEVDCFCTMSGNQGSKQTE